MADEWTQVTQEGTGRVYYVNNSTGETSWVKPAAAKVAAEVPLPEGWVEKKARAGNIMRVEGNKGRAEGS